MISLCPSMLPAQRQSVQSWPAPFAVPSVLLAWPPSAVARLVVFAGGNCCFVPRWLQVFVWEQANCDHNNSLVSASQCSCGCCRVARSTGNNRTCAHDFS